MTPRDEPVVTGSWRFPVAKRPSDPTPDFASRNGWDAEYEVYDDFDLPTYVGPVSCPG
jgi:hypothetical protein